jgi:hypothetical protein
MKHLNSLSDLFRNLPTMSIQSSTNESHGARDSFNQKWGLTKEQSTAGYQKAGVVRNSSSDTNQTHILGGYFVSPGFNLVGVSGGGSWQSF